MGSFRLFIAVAVLGYILYAYHGVIAQVGASTSPDLPAPTTQTAFDFHPVDLSGCGPALNSLGNCPVRQGQGVVPPNE